MPAVAGKDENLTIQVIKVWALKKNNELKDTLYSGKLHSLVITHAYNIFGCIGCSKLVHC